MTKAHVRKDKGTAPATRRKLHKTVISKGKRGGKAFAVEKRPIQMELFAKTAEAKSKAGKAKTKARGERDTGRTTVPKPQAPKFANMNFYAKCEKWLRLSVNGGKSAVAKPCNRGVSMGYGISEINVYLKGVDAHTRRRLRAMKLKQRKRKRFILGYLVKMGVSKARADKQVFSGRKGIWKLSHIPAVEG